MPRTKGTDKLEALRKQAAQIQAQIQAGEARQREQARKDDTRRKVIAGALALEHMEKNAPSEFAKIMTRLLDEYVTRPNDRALFDGLPERTDEKPETTRGRRPATSSHPETSTAAAE